MATLLRDRETALASLRSEMAAARIETAKREAELVELRQLVVQLRHQIAEGRQVILDQQQTADIQQAELKEVKAERDQLKQAKIEPAAQQTGNDPLNKLAQEVEQLKKGLARQQATPLAAIKQPSIKSELATTEKEPSVSAMMLRPSLPAAESTAPSQVKVVRGDTLSSLARRHRTTVAAIVSINALRSEQIEVGQTLLIPVAGTSIP
jgi:LysM repeat protein